MKIPFFDRTRGDRAIEADLVDAFQRVVQSGHYVLGAEVTSFEAAAARFLGVSHAVGVSSGTDALLVSLMALGVGPGDEVIVPAYSFFATAGVVARLGARPVFVDVVPDAWTMDPAAVARSIGPRTRAVMPVHLFGRTANMKALREAAFAVPIVEDAAQAFGAREDGAMAGKLGALGCFSFFPTKNLGGFGDGGLVTAEDATLADRVRLLRVHGGRPKHFHAEVGGNFRLDALQAALLSVKLSRVEDALARRREIAGQYREMLAGLPIGLPPEDAGHTYNQFVVRVRDGRRDALRRSLQEWGVGTEVYYPLPLPHQACFAALGHREGDFPAAEAGARETLALPIFPELREEEVAHVATGVRRFLEG
jgi:dTDP-4-amino-4,6-dideoxygalactose transaminase